MSKGSIKYDIDENDDESVSLSGAEGSLTIAKSSEQPRHPTNYENF